MIAVVVLAGCAPSSAPEPLVGISGNAAMHPISQLLGTSAAISGAPLRVDVYDAAELIADPEAGPLSGAAISTSGCGAADAYGRPVDQGCGFALGKVNVAGATAGLLAIVSGDSSFVKVATGIATGETVGAVNPGDELTAPSPVAVASTDVLDRIAGAIGGLRKETWTRDDLLCRGIAIGVLLDERQRPVSSAQVSLAFEDADVYLIDAAAALGQDGRAGTADDSAVELLAGSQTDLTGMYVVVPRRSAGGCDSASQKVQLAQLDASDGVRSWEDVFPLIPSTVFVRYLLPNASPRIAGPVPVQVSGAVQMHPLAALVGATPTVQGQSIQVDLLDPASLVQGQAALASQTPPTAGCNQLDPGTGQPTDPGCPVAFTSFDADSATAGLFARVSGDASLVPVLTAIAPGTTFASCQAGEGLTAAAPFGALPASAEGSLAAIAGGTLGQSWAPGELSCRGFVAGALLGANGQPASGATIAVSGLSSKVLYVNLAAAFGSDGMPGTGDDQPQLLLSGTQTDSTGLYLVVPDPSLTCASAPGVPGQVQLVATDGNTGWSDSLLVVPGTMTSSYTLPLGVDGAPVCQP